MKIIYMQGVYNEIQFGGRLMATVVKRKATENWMEKEVFHEHEELHE